MPDYSDDDHLADLKRGGLLQREIPKEAEERLVAQGLATERFGGLKITVKGIFHPHAVRLGGR